MSETQDRYRAVMLDFVDRSWGVIDTQYVMSPRMGDSKAWVMIEVVSDRHHAEMLAQKLSEEERARVDATGTAAYPIGRFGR